MQFFRPTMLDVIVITFFNDMLLQPPTDEPWCSCRASPPENEWE
jgi:hypothetical protein